ncbi:MAG: pyruvate dehydrogenase (acetyl-transferring) E1 component subunit alpha [Chloroflexi bacterium]|nr:MAG: pyruvate dehydrogenase (acetyl-transferring) E1 component subunit alpha [Chloroflexota bacterium]
MYRDMVRIRAFEEMVQQLFMQSLMSGTTHLAQGQEAVAVGAARAMRPDDYSTYTYRGHHHALARGLELEAAFAELLGRATGVNRGKGGSMHLTQSDLGLYGSFAIVGAGLPVAVGLGRAAQLRRDGRVSLSFFGDGATNIGAFHEAMNLASVWKAPVIFVCENNLYGEYSALRSTTPVEDLAIRASSYAMRAQIVDGNDVIAVFDAASAAIARAREGEGPTFLECKTYRHRGHSRSDPAKYRPAEEVQAWMARDPLIIARDKLAESEAHTDADLDRIDAEIGADIDAAAERAKSAPWPDLREVITNVYA